MPFISDQCTICTLSMRYQSMKYCYALIPAICYRYAINLLSVCYKYANVRLTCYQYAINMPSRHMLCMNYLSIMNTLSINYYYAITILLPSLSRSACRHYIVDYSACRHICPTFYMVHIRSLSPCRMFCTLPPTTHPPTPIPVRVRA